jgi:hypothetical protein
MSKKKTTNETGQLRGDQGYKNSHQSTGSPPPNWVEHPYEASTPARRPALNLNHRPAEVLADFTSERSLAIAKAKEVPPPLPKRRRSKETFVINLADEIAPLVSVVNSRLPFGTRPLQSEYVGQPLIEIPWGGKTVINPREVEIPLYLVELGVGRAEPNGLRRQIVWTLVRYAQLGGGLSPGWLPPTQREHALGSLRSPLEFTWLQESSGYGYNGPGWRCRLKVSCAEITKLSAIRMQVTLLSQVMADPANLLPLCHAGMLA